MEKATRQRTTMALAALVILAVALPYGVAWLAAGSEYVFGGFLLNPLDGNTYLAKMVQGQQGAWRFTLPYTAETGQGHFLFLFYLFLGHVAGWLGAPPVFVFHGARLLAVVALYLALGDFYRRLFGSDRRGWRMAMWLAGVGSGLGWAAAGSGALTADFWVAEAYPFLAAYANPHFPLGLALMLYLLADSEPPAVPGWRHGLLRAAAGCLLATILPFGVVLLGVIFLGRLALAWRQTWRDLLACWIWPLAPGGLVLIYQYAVTLTDPVLAGWNAQNLTPAPPVWDFLLSFSPALLLALAGGWALWRQPGAPLRTVLPVWLLAGVVLVYLPFNLQRRFLLGLYIPVAGLAVWGIRRLRLWRGLYALVLLLSLPTNLLVLAAGVFGAGSHDPAVYLTRGEYAALQWIEANTPAGALVLCGDESGLLVPAYTGRRVLYGHLFETVAAEGEKATVQRFYRGEMTAQQGRQLLAGRGVNYLWYGPRERRLSSLRPENLLGIGVEGAGWLQRVYEQDGVTLYVVGELP